MRRKISEQKNEFSDLPDLTHQQAAFVKAVLDGKNASDAYRSAYNTENMKPETIWAAASRLRNHSDVCAWLGQAAKAELGQASRTLEQHIRRLDRLQQIAIETGNVGAAVQAEQLIGKAQGHYTEQFKDMSQNPIDSLKEIAELSPELARQLALQAGIAWNDGKPH